MKFPYTFLIAGYEPEKKEQRDDGNDVPFGVSSYLAQEHVRSTKKKIEGCENLFAGLIRQGCTYKHIADMRFHPFGSPILWTFGRILTCDWSQENVVRKNQNNQSSDPLSLSLLFFICQSGSGDLRSKQHHEDHRCHCFLPKTCTSATQHNVKSAAWIILHYGINIQLLAVP